MSTPPPTPGASTAGPSAPSTASASAQNSTAKEAGAFAKRFPRASSAFQKYASTRAGRLAGTAWARKRPIFLVLGLAYGALNYSIVKAEATRRDTIHPDTWLVVKVHPGSIVDCKSATNLTALLTSPTAGEDRATVMELVDVIRALKMAAGDDRVRGIFADFSGLHVPSSVSPASLGLAQLEELVEAVHEFKISKREQYYLKQALSNQEIKSLVENLDPEAAGKEKMSEVQVQMTESIEKAKKDAPLPPPSTIAWADSFDSQGSYLLASVFDHVYLQPSGGVPLTGVSMQIPFAKRALDWLGVKVYADARKEYKSMISTFTQTDGLPPAQLENSARLAGELARGIAHTVGVNRFPDIDPEEAADKVSELTKKGPFSAQEALKEGLITGIKYKSEAIKELNGEPRLKTLASYSRITSKSFDQMFDKESRVNVAIVYLQGTISNAPGEYSTSSVIRGLKEAGEDKDIEAIVLRIDSGGGDVVASDSIWDAVRRVQQDSKKPVIASFGNVCASGGYYASAGADAILAGETTITGSIGVASLRPTLTKKVFDRVGVTLQTIFTGSKTDSSIHELSPDEKARQSRHIDETYDSFLEKVCDGRKISRDVIEELAGGRVWTGLAAWERRSTEKGVSSGKSQEQAAVNLEKARSKSGTKVEKITTLPDKMVSLAIDWSTTDITQEEEMSTIRIDGSSASPEGASPPVAAIEIGDNDEKASSLEPSEEQGEKQVVGGRQVVAASVIEGEGKDEEDHLAAAAHEAAERSRQEKVETIVPEEEKIGPYGHGLVDFIGGIYTAGTLAAQMAVDKKMSPLLEKGMTHEDASVSLYPTAPTETLLGGKKVLLTDVRMIKYPKEKTFGERLREMNRKGDQPSLSLLPGFGNIGMQFREMVTDVAVQVLVKAWRDPAMIQRMIGEVEKERGMRMEYQSGVHM